MGVNYKNAVLGSMLSSFITVNIIVISSSSVSEECSSARATREAYIPIWQSVASATRFRPVAALFFWFAFFGDGLEPKERDTFIGNKIPERPVVP